MTPEESMYEQRMAQIPKFRQQDKNLMTVLCVLFGIISIGMAFFLFSIAFDTLAINAEWNQTCGKYTSYLLPTSLTFDMVWMPVLMIVVGVGFFVAVPFVRKYFNKKPDYEYIKRGLNDTVGTIALIEYHRRHSEE